MVEARDSRVLSRESELARLKEFVAGQGDSACMVLVGDPGMGKTTLWDEGVVLARKTGAGGRRAATEDRLTPSEERVAALAASGLSNKEIARQLLVSVYTVEEHLSHAYAKLGIRSRSQLAAHLGDRG